VTTSVSRPISRSIVVDSISERNRLLMQSAIRAAEPRFDDDLALVRYTDQAGKRDGGHVAQESLEYAVALAELDLQPNRVRRIVAATLKYQDQRRQSLTFGNWRWMHNWECVGDVNAASFMVPNYWCLLTRHQSLLGESLAQQVLDALRLAAHALLAHRSQWACGNIFLLNILGKLQIAQVTRDDRLRDIAYWDYQEWLSYTNRFGIIEFNSPNYTAVQISALEGMLDVCSHEGMRHSIEVVLRFYYTELFSHFHSATGRFAGPKSRQLDELIRDGGGHSDALLFRQTGFECLKDSPYNARYALSTYVAPRTARSLVSDRRLPAIVRGNSPYHGLLRYTYLTDQFALGSMSGGRHAGSDVPIELLYGTRDRAHCVALRGKPHVFTVFAKQQRNFIVAGLRWRFRPKDERNTLAAPVALLGSNIVGSDGYVSDDHTQPEATFSFAEMSTGPTVWIGDDRWGGEDCPLPVDTPLVVRVGTVAIGYRASGPCGQRLAWEDDRLVLTITASAPGMEPWMGIHSFALAVVPVSDESTENDFIEAWRCSTLHCETHGQSLRLNAEMNDNRVTTNVPLEPTHLFEAGPFVLPQGRLTSAAWREPAQPLWRRF